MIIRIYQIPRFEAMLTTEAKSGTRGKHLGRGSLAGVLTMAINWQLVHCRIYGNITIRKLILSIAN